MATEDENCSVCMRVQNSLVRPAFQQDWLVCIHCTLEYLELFTQPGSLITSAQRALYSFASSEPLPGAAVMVAIRRIAIGCHRELLILDEVEIAY